MVEFDFATSRTRRRAKTRDVNRRDARPSPGPWPGSGEAFFRGAEDDQDEEPAQNGEENRQTSPNPGAIDALRRFENALPAVRTERFVADLGAVASRTAEHSDLVSRGRMRAVE